MNTLESKCKNLADKAMCVGMSDSDIAMHGLDYRKGKYWKDVANAVKKGKREGMGRTETELEMIAFRLSRVLKEAKGKQ